MVAEGALMTVKEADRAAVMLAVLERRLKQREAAERLGLSVDVRDRVDAAKAAQAARPDWKPAPDHPWRRSFKPARAAA